MRRLLYVLVAVAAAAAVAADSPAVAAPPTPAKQATAIGTGGAAASVDPLATQTAIDVLRGGGNAVDAAVTAAAVLGVVEPLSCGIGGRGFMTIYRASDGRVFTLDGRETAPAAFRPDSFIDPATGQPIPFAEGVTSASASPSQGRLVCGRRRLPASAAGRWPRSPRLRSPSPAPASRSTRPSATRSSPTSPASAIFTSTRALYGEPPAV